MYDAIVIGSRCAGAPTAMLLSRQGRRTLVVDRAMFPSDTLSGHTIQPAGMARLKRWGLLDRVEATGVPFASTVRFDFGDVVLEGRPTPVDGLDAAVCIRRTVIDPLLADAAAEAGAELRFGTTVTELVMDGDRVIGISGHGPDGSAFEERAPVVIGADGARSFVARAVGAETLVHRPATTTTVYSYFRDVEIEGLELYARPGRFFVAAPTNDGLTFVAQQVPVGIDGCYGGRTEEAFFEVLGGVPRLAERVSPGARTERFRVGRIADSFIRRSHGRGWALVGDAACHKDPITAQGMLDALRDAELLASAIDRGLDGDLDAALADYQARRDAAVRPMFDHTCTLADLETPPPAEMFALIGALAEQPDHISRFLGVTAGSVGVDEFFAPDSVAEIMGRVVAA